MGNVPSEMKLLRSEVAFGSEAAYGCEVASQRSVAEGGKVKATHHHSGLGLTVNRLPLTRELSPKVTEGESYNILLLSLTSNNKLGFSPSVTRGVTPPSSEGGTGRVSLCL